MRMNLNKRFRILLLGAPGCGKSQAILDIARFNPDSKVIAFDRQDGISPLLDDELPNFELRLIAGEPVDAWPEFRQAVKDARASVGPNDWICFDSAGDWWDMAQEWFVQVKYGDDLADYLMRQATRTDKKNPLGFGGIETSDWQVIKAQYYTTMPQTLGASCSANVLVTALVKDVVSYEKDGQIVYRESGLMPIYKDVGVKPDGEKTLTAQVNTVVQIDHPTQGKWRLRGLGKRGEWGTFDWEDATNKAVVEVLKEKAGA